MDSPARKLLKQKDYQRHKMFRKMARKRKAKAEQEQKVAEKALKRKLKLPKYDKGEDDNTPNPKSWKALNKIEYQVIPDSTFTRDKTGAGSIEYFNAKDSGIRYKNGYYKKHPSPGNEVILYNPKENDEQDIALDALHIMPKDATYDVLNTLYRNAAREGDVFYNAKMRYDLDVKTYGAENIDPFELYFNNEADGLLRNMFIEGSPEYIESKRYYPNKAQLEEWNKHLMPYINDIRKYLETGQMPSNVLPEVVIKGKKRDKKIKMPKYDNGDKLNIFRKGDGSFVYQEDPNSEEIPLTPLLKAYPEPKYWTYTDANGRVYTPKQLPTSDPGEIKPAEQKNVLESALDNYVGELKYDLNNNVPVGGKYTMPAIAASALLPLAGEYVAGTSIAGIPTTTLMNNAIGLGFAGHGLNHLFNEGINGYGDAAMTALELSPLGKLSLPIYRTGKAFASPFVLLVVNDGKWLWNKGNIIQKTIPYNPNNFYRGVGKEALKDAKESGVIRGKYFKNPYFGKAKDWWNDGVVYEGTPERIDWIDAYPYDEEGKVIPFSNLFPFNALPYENGSTIVPTKNFSYWLKYPIIGWRKHNFKNSISTLPSNVTSTINKDFLSTDGLFANSNFDNNKFILFMYRDMLLKSKSDITYSKLLSDKVVDKQIPDNLIQIYKNSIIPRLEAARPGYHGGIMYPTIRAHANKALKDGYTVYPEEVFLNAGEDKDIVGLAYNKTGHISIKDGYDDFALGHEVRHRLLRTLAPTIDESLRNVEAYGDEFIKLSEEYPELANMNMGKEMDTTTYDARRKLLGDNVLSTWNVDLLNIRIDKTSDEAIVNAFENANGYGKKLIETLKRQNKLTPERILALREVLKHNGAIAVPIAVGAAAYQNYDRGKDKIHIKPSKRGTFTAAAKRKGMGVQEFARKVLSAPKGKYSSAMRKKANFARNASKFKH